MSFLVNSLNEMDQNFLKCVSCLYSADTLTKSDAIHLQMHLEEAIKAKTGVTKDFTHLVMCSLKQPLLEDFKPIIYDESKGSNSDNELELDLLKDDLMCVVCHEMDVGARNRLLECSDCHALYHQECHRPVVSNQDSFDSWVCQKCKDASKKAKLSQAVPSPPPQCCNCGGNPCCPNCSPNSLPTNSHRHSNSSSVISSSSSSYKVSSSVSSSTKGSDKYSKSSSSSTIKSSSTTTISGSSSSTVPKSTSSMGMPQRSTVTPNINIISADKRLQIMKKKAAKLQEKRKQLPR